jgi:hypothetical protein
MNAMSYTESFGTNELMGGTKGLISGTKMPRRKRPDCEISKNWIADRIIEFARESIAVQPWQTGAEKSRGSDTCTGNQRREAVG